MSFFPLAALALAMLFFPGVCLTAAIRGCGLWAQAVLPGLFPFLTVMLLLQNAAHKKSLLAAGAMGFLSGSPGGARLAQGLPATRAQLTRYAVAAGVMSPMFLLSVLPLWTRIPGCGPMLLACHWLGALASFGVMQLLLPDKGAPSSPIPTDAVETPSVPETPMLAIIQSAAQALIVVCGCMMLGSVLSALAARLFHLSAPLAAIVQALLEITAGVKALCALPLSPAALLCCVSAACALGGLSILLQNLSFYQNGVKLLWLLAGRMLHAIFSAGLCALCCLFVPFTQDAAAAVLTPSWSGFGALLPLVLSLLLPGGTAPRLSPARRK